MADKRNIIHQIVLESKAYSVLEDIEKLVENDQSLAVVPVQPLYVAMTAASSDQVAAILPKLSPKQRQVILDLDLWKKDEVNYQSFDYWIETYAKVQNSDVLHEFVQSEDFSLYLRSRINIYTFDVEDPMYPDHDFYFLTDDSLLLIEYGEDYQNPNELKYLIRNLYDKMGVEKAYAHLFKVVNDSHLILEERQYQSKKERLKDYGFVDYFDALEQLVEFISYKAMDSFIHGHQPVTGKITNESKNQSLHNSALIGFDVDMDKITEALERVQDPERLSYLHFTFVRLINSTITLNDALKGGRVELARISKQSRMILNLGLQYVDSLGSHPIIFDIFDFFDLYRIGKSLLLIERKRLKKALKKSKFDQDDYEYFLGAWWNTFLENTFLDYPKIKTYGAGLHTQEIQNLNSFFFWKEQTHLLCDLIPFASQFFESFSLLKKDGRLHDEFYLNYEVANIDLEAILISSFINFCLGNFEQNDVNKMGITINELKSFFASFFEKREDEYILKPLDDAKIQEQLNSFLSHFGMNGIKKMDEYLHGILSEHLSGYEFDTLSDEEFRHIGGPILLNTLTKN